MSSNTNKLKKQLDNLTRARQNYYDRGNHWICSKVTIDEQAAKMIVDALMKKPNEITKLTFSHNRFTKEAIQIIADYLRTSETINEVDFYANDLQNEGVVPIIIAISKNPKITCLRLMNEHMTSDEGARALTRLLQANQNIECLSVSGHRFFYGSYFGEFANAVKNHPSLRSLILSSYQLSSSDASNQLSSSDACVLAEALVSNKVLEYLNIGFNKFDPEVASSMAQLIRQNNTLTSINLTECDFDEKGNQEILNAIDVNSALQYLPLRTHGDEKHRKIEKFPGYRKAKAIIDRNNMLSVIRTNIKILSGQEKSWEGIRIRDRKSDYERIISYCTDLEKLKHCSKITIQKLKEEALSALNNPTDPLLKEAILDTLNNPMHNPMNNPIHPDASGHGLLQTERSSQRNNSSQNEGLSLEMGNADSKETKDREEPVRFVNGLGGLEEKNIKELVRFVDDFEDKNFKHDLIKAARDLYSKLLTTHFEKAEYFINELERYIEEFHKKPYFHDYREHNSQAYIMFDIFDTRVLGKAPYSLNEFPGEDYLIHLMQKMNQSDDISEDFFSQYQDAWNKKYQQSLKTPAAKQTPSSDKKRQSDTPKDPNDWVNVKFSNATVNKAKEFYATLLKENPEKAGYFYRRLNLHKKLSRQSFHQFKSFSPTYQVFLFFNQNIVDSKRGYSTAKPLENILTNIMQDTLSYSKSTKNPAKDSSKNTSKPMTTSSRVSTPRQPLSFRSNQGDKGDTKQSQEQQQTSQKDSKGKRPGSKH